VGKFPNSRLTPDIRGDKDRGVDIMSAPLPSYITGADITMPHLLWPFFNNNRPLLSALFRAATRAMLRWARRQGVEVGIFCALHTYGRQLNQHPHIHLSVTRGGLDMKHGVWRDIYFKKQAVEEIWRGAVIRLLRHSYDLIKPGSLPGLGHIRDRKQWQRYLESQYGRRWKVHFAKKFA